MDPKAEARFIAYADQLKTWSAQVEDVENNVTAQLEQLRTIKDKEQVLTRAGFILQDYNASITSLRQSFQAIIPPPEFQNSHAFLARIVDNYPRLQALLNRFQPALQTLANPGASDSQKQAVFGQVVGTLRQLNQFVSDEHERFYQFLEALKLDLGRLPDSLAPK